MLDQNANVSLSGFSCLLLSRDCAYQLLNGDWV